MTPEKALVARRRERAKIANATAASNAIFNSQDAAQIEKDVTRCTWHLLTGNQRAQRLQMEHKRNKKVARLIHRKQSRLGNLINWTLVQSYQLTEEQQQEQQQQTTYTTTTVTKTTDDGTKKDDEKLHYYQGYHDVACIFLSTLGGTSSGRIPGIPGTLPPLAPAIASGLDLPAAVLLQVSQSHFRDCMRPDFMCLQTALRLALFPLIAVADPDVHAHLYDVDMEPFFAISWILTWFAHEIRDTAAVKRLFDVFLVSHPLMPIYMSVAMVVHPINRREVLATERDFADVHQTLAGLPKNSSMVGFKYRPGDGYVSDHETDEDGTLSTGALSLEETEFFVEQGGRLDDDDEPHSLVSASLSSTLEPPAKVPFQELIDNSVKLMQKYPPRTLVALATRYYGQEQVSTLLEQASPAGISMMEAPPAWASTPTAKADWVLKQRARERKGLSAKNRRDRRRENKRARSRSRSRGASVTRGRGFGNEEKEEAADESNKSRGRNRVISAPAVDSKSIKKYLTANSHRIPVIAIGHGAGDDEERRRRKRRKLVMAGVAAVAVASIVGAMLQSREDVTLLQTSGEPALGMVGDTAREMTATVEKNQSIERDTNRSLPNRSRAVKMPVEQVPRAIPENRVPHTVTVVQKVAIPKVSTPKVAIPEVVYSSVKTNPPVPPAAKPSSWVVVNMLSVATSKAGDQKATGRAPPLDDKMHPFLQLGKWTKGAAKVISKRVAAGLTKLGDHSHADKLQPLLKLGKWTKGVVAVTWKRVATGLTKLSEHSHLVGNLQPLLELGEWGRKLFNEAPPIHHVGKSLKVAYQSPGVQEVASALRDASVLAHYGKK